MKTNQPSVDEALNMVIVSPAEGKMSLCCIVIF